MPVTLEKRKKRFPHGGKIMLFVSCRIAYERVGNTRGITTQLLRSVGGPEVGTAILAFISDKSFLFEEVQRFLQI